MSDWLTDTTKQFTHYEAPQRYYYWSLLAAVSAILKDSVWFDMQIYKLYPNAYILLYGPSGVKKGPSINLAKSIVKHIDNTRVISGRATVEAIIKEIAQVYHSKGGMITDNAAFVVSSELSSSIVSNPNSLDIMTDLFDRIYNEGSWNSLLKGDGTQRLTSPTITWLSGSNDALLKEFIPEKNLKGGLFGRTFVISEHEESTINSLMFPLNGGAPDKIKIAQDIEHIQELKGPFQMEDEVRHEFDNFYKTFKTKHAKKINDETGTVARMGDHIIRVAMLISTARRADLCLRIEDIEESIKEVLPLVIPSKKIANTAKGNELGLHEKRALIITELGKNGPIAKTELLRKFILKMDQEDLNRIIITLETAGFIKHEYIGNDFIYFLNEEREEVREYVQRFK